MKNKTIKMRGVNYLSYVDEYALGRQCASGRLGKPDTIAKLNLFWSGYTRYTALVLLLLTLSAWSLLSANTPDLTSRLPEWLENQLERQAVAMSSVYLRYREKQSGEDVPSFYGGPTTYLACFDSNRFNIRTEMLYPGETKPRIHEDVYDGAIFYYGDPDRSGHIPAILKQYLPGDKKDEEQSTRLYFQCLDYAGFYFPQHIGTLNEFHSIESIVMHYVKECSAITIKTNGDNIIITVHIPDPIITPAKQVNLNALKKDTTDLHLKLDSISNEVKSTEFMQTLVPLRKVVFTLSAKVNYAVEQRDEFAADGQKIVHIQADEWKYYEREGIWLPGRTIATYYTGRFNMSGFSKEPCLIVTSELLEVLFGQQSDIPFSLDYTNVGSLIVDRSSPSAVRQPGHYIMFKVAAGGRQLYDTAMGIRPEMSRTRSWIIVIMFVCLLIPPIILIFHKLRK